MRRMRWLGIALLVLVGCESTDNTHLKPPLREEYNLPPGDDARFSSPITYPKETLNQAPAASEFDGLWLGFRDRFGFVWGQRLREQFNISAKHAGWPTILRWQGLRLLPGQSLPAPETQSEMLTTLQALMKRFGQET